MKTTVHYQNDGRVVSKLASDALQYDATALAFKYHQSREFYYAAPNVYGDVNHKTMGDDDDDDERQARRLRRRRQKAQVVNCCKKFIAFLFSHIGLAGAC